MKRNRRPSTDILWRLATNVQRLRKARGIYPRGTGQSVWIQQGVHSKVEQELLNISIANLEALTTGLECSLVDLTMSPPEDPGTIPLASVRRQ
jgi:hypothetical protein